jgi:hypothetical protein
MPVLLGMARDERKGQDVGPHISEREEKVVTIRWVPHATSPKTILNSNFKCCRGWGFILNSFEHVKVYYVIFKLSDKLRRNILILFFVVQII